MSNRGNPGTLAQTLYRARGRNNEGVVGLAIVLLVVVVGSVAPSFWSLATIFNVLHNSYSPMVLALDVLLIMLIGGIDVSFDSIGIFAAYAVATVAAQGVLGDHVWLMFLAAGGIGLCLGLVNATMISIFRLPILITTLGTRGIFAGILLAFIGSSFVNDLPASMESFGSAYLLQTKTASGLVAGLQILIIPVAITCVIVALGLRYTVIGRGIYAIGSDEEAARRAGFSTGIIKLLVFCCAGALAGTAGMMHVSLIGFADPHELVGNELIVIAAVVLGGTSIFGGRGSVLGTILGVILLELIQYSLITMGIPSSWDHVAIGFLLLVGITLQVVQYRGSSLQRLFATWQRAR